MPFDPHRGFTKPIAKSPVKIETPEESLPEPVAPEVA